MELGNYKEAFDVWRKIIENAKKSENFYNAGLCQHFTQNYENSNIFLNNALKCHSNDDKIY